MCFRPGRAVKKRQVFCANCKTMNPLPLSVQSTIGEIMKNEIGKASLEKNCAVMVNDPNFKKAFGATLKMVKPISKGKITQEMIDLVAADLAQIPWEGVCKSCGESLPKVK